MESFEIIVHIGINVIKCGCCDVEHISLITLIQVMYEEHTRKERVPNEDYCVFVQLLWRHERVKVKTDSELIEVFGMFKDRGLSTIVFGVKKKPHIPLPPVVSSYNPNSNPEVEVNNYQGLSWSDIDNEVFNYNGDIEEVGSDRDDVEVIKQVEMVGAVTVFGDDVDNEYLNLFKGYQSIDDNEFFSDSDLEKHESKIALLMKDNKYLNLFEGYQSIDDDEFFSDSDLEKHESKIARLMKSSVAYIRMQQPEPKFHKFILSFEAQKLGFLEGCRPFIGLDGCHLKRPYKGNGEYELLGPTGTYGVKLKEFTCQCGSWQISGVPCSHAMAVISHAYGRDAIKNRVDEFVHQSLTKSAYVQTYKSMIYPFSDLTMWLEVHTAHLIPPLLHATPGMPKLQRRRELNDRPKNARSGSVVCKKCFTYYMVAVV
ncbi:hypothetical protein Dsin_000750 [Dipteronia sinensis]|uniref:SWIM-type domain-containing protein n=1 Tax=Dipteronia sinensis TaxID=43782 RepID=A0AAE0B422_9ROSI|nr:hypothetical protein Dsin_000750 [Dipteronia sinensis]